LYAEKMKMSEDLIVLQRDQFNPKDAMLPDRLSDLDLVMEDAVALKFLDKPMTKDELTELFQIPPAGS
jgi:NitT/TauT family transport system substrate-binding protein